MVVVNHKNTDFTTPIFSNNKSTAIAISGGGFLFLDLKRKQGKIIGTTKKEALEELSIMGRIDEFPNF